MLLLTVAVAQVQATLGKSTYAMSHPFAYKAWMEKYLPVAENIVQANNTATCVEWVKLCVDDGTRPFTCSGPSGNFQVHSVGAYARYAGTKSLETLETEFSAALGDMKTYDPYMEQHVGLYTAQLDEYIKSFTAGKVPTFSSSFTGTGGKTYYSVLAQVDGSLAAGAGSELLIEIIGDKSTILSARGDALYHHATPRASATSLSRAEAHFARPDVLLSVGAGANTLPSLTPLHISFATANVTAQLMYFEDVVQGTKVSFVTANGTSTYNGHLFSDDTLEVRFTQTAKATQGPVTIAAWEAYRLALHKTCIPSPNTANQGFDRLADFHVGGHGPPGPDAGGAAATIPLDVYIKKQIAMGMPYRVYSPPGGVPDASQPANNHFLYLYGPNGWGYQITGSCTDTTVCCKTAASCVFYDMCTQGITLPNPGVTCRADLPPGPDFLQG